MGEAGSKKKLKAKPILLLQARFLGALLTCPLPPHHLSFPSAVSVSAGEMCPGRLPNAVRVVQAAEWYAKGGETVF